MYNALYREYDSVMIHKQTLLSKEYFQGTAETNEKAALTVLRYALDSYVCLPPEIMLRRLNDRLVKQLHLIQIIKYIRIPPEFGKSKGLYMVMAAYNYKKVSSLKFRTEYLYSQILSGSHQRFPDDYFFSEHPIEKAVICLRYAIKKYYVHFDLKLLYNTFISPDINDILSKWKLSSACHILFDTPADYLHEAYQGHLSDSYYKQACNIMDIRKEGYPKNENLCIR